MMFEVRATEQSGLGVFATEMIPVGTLIIREKPFLEINPDEVKKEVERLKNIKLERHKNIKFDREIFARKIVMYSFVIEQFIRLSAEDQKDFFCLHDAFQYLESSDKSSLLDVETLEVLLQRDCFEVPLTLTTAAKIIGIYNTNSVEFGVCRQLARVNHSCIPTAELLTNTDLDTQDLRAVRTINKGEEITANYADLEDGLNKEYRLSFLWDNFRLSCCCPCCQYSGADLARDEERRGEMMRLHHLLNTCKTPQDIIKNINQQIKLAKY